jgi:CRISPR type IV-associated protein Csf3
MYNFLKVTAYLETNIICNDFITFDGIISYLESLSYVARGIINPDALVTEDDLIDIPIPIEKYKFEDDFVYKSSIGLFDGIETIEKWKKKYPTEYIHFIENKKVGINRGTRKDYNMPMISFSTDKIIFYVVGKKQNISVMLKKMKFLGKKSSQGYGKVRKWSIEDVEEKNCFWFLRSFPIKFVNLVKYIGSLDFDFSLISRFSSYKPPYWARKNHTICYLPNETNLI